VQLLHGGPHTMNRDAFSYRWNSHVFASPGYIVAWVNRHGSTGFGEAFARSINGSLGRQADGGHAQGQRLPVRALPGHRPQQRGRGRCQLRRLSWRLAAGPHQGSFKAIINHAGVSDFMGQYGADTTTYGFTKEVMGGTPWDSPEGHAAQQPDGLCREFQDADADLHGEKDYRVPYGQGLALYGILQTMRRAVAAGGVSGREPLDPERRRTPSTGTTKCRRGSARYIGGKPVLEKPNFDVEPGAPAKG
jgi:hypothetical protein